MDLSLAMKIEEDGTEFSTAEIGDRCTGPSGLGELEELCYTHACKHSFALVEF